MLEIINNPGGGLVHLAPHISHKIVDKSSVPLPDIGYTGITMYVPVYTEKGPTNDVRLYNGASAYNTIVKTYGEPNARKYGLPYSGALLHASMGGAVVLQSLKAPGAAHASVVVLMRIKAEGRSTTKVKNKIAYIFDGGVKPIVDNETKRTKYVPTDTIDGGKPLFDALYSGANNTEGMTEFVRMADNTVVNEKFNPIRFTSIPFGPNEVVNIDGETRRPLNEAEVDSITDQEAKAVAQARVAAWKAYGNLWKPLDFPGIEVEFEAVPMNELTTKLKELNERFTLVDGATSWDALSAIVSSIPASGLNTKRRGSASIEDAITQAKDGNGFDVTIPLFWGMHTGKGKYGNNYTIDFKNTTDDIEGLPLMLASIMDRKQGGIIINDSKRAIALSNIIDRGTPFLLDSVYSEPLIEGFKFETASINALDRVGLLIQSYLKNYLKYEDGKYSFFKPNGNYDTRLDGHMTTTTTVYGSDGRGVSKSIQSYGPTGDRLLQSLVKTIEKLDQPEDSTLHRLSYLDLTKLKQEEGFIKSPGLTTYNFSGGHEGEFQFMREFDFNFNFNDEKLNSMYKDNPDFQRYKLQHGGEKILQKLYIQAFDGTLSAEVNSLFANPADYVIDFGYPDPVKHAMYSFGKERRDDVQLLFNTRTDAHSIHESIAHKNSLNFEGRNCYWFPGNFEWIDAFSKVMRVPQTFTLIPTLLNHYEEGFNSSIAGIARGSLSLVSAYTARGVGNMTYVEKDILYKNGLNILSAYRNGELYLDSQLANYKLNKRSSLQEFHNNSIINRILKECYIKLQHYKHEISSEETAKVIQDKINKELEKYASKVKSFSYEAKFDSTYDKAIGLLSHYLNIEFFNTIKYHRIELTALEIS